jgi:outer membrane protein assembly factor BamE (lipoprotein component of BamABCDE complex)
MKNIIYFIIIIVLHTSCSFEKVVKHHGIHYLEKKQENIKVFENNKNDVKSLLGPPSTSSSFDKEVWIYIERKTTVSELRTLGRKKILVNNALVLEFDNRGLLVQKTFYDKENMNKIKIAKDNTKVLNKKKSFINSVLTSLRHKINDPLGQRKAK